MIKSIPTFHWTHKTTIESIPCTHGRGYTPDYSQFSNSFSAFVQLGTFFSIDFNYETLFLSHELISYTKQREQGNEHNRTKKKKETERKSYDNNNKITEKGSEFQCWCMKKNAYVLRFLLLLTIGYTYLEVDVVVISIQLNVFSIFFCLELAVTINILPQKANGFPFCINAHKSIYARSKCSSCLYSLGILCKAFFYGFYVMCLVLCDMKFRISLTLFYLIV